MKTKIKSAGQSLVEFALILPLFMVLIMALFDIGRAVLYYAALNTAAREGTRFAIVQPANEYDTSEIYPLNCNIATSTANTKICDEITDKLFGISELSGSTILIDHFDNSNGDPLIWVGIELAYNPITPGLDLIGAFNLNVESQMLVTPIARE